MSEQIERVIGTVLDNVDIAPRHRVITVEAPHIARLARPGHFVNVLTADSYDPLLRKPFSVFTVDRPSGVIQLLFSVVGGTTRRMASKRAGDHLDIIGPLGGRVFHPSTELNARHVMVGGGYGVPPLVFLASELLKRTPNADINFLIGARERELLLCLEHLQATGIRTHTSTEDGSHGLKGRITDVLAPILGDSGRETTVYCCGPTPMMRAVGELCQSAGVSCQVSVEVGMPCGVGVCMACVIDVKNGKRVRCCTDGPVFDASEVLW